MQQLYRVFQHYEAELVEINPLMITFDGKLIAADGKISLDDSALFRHTQFTKNRDYFQTDLEYEAAMEGLPFIQFDGDIAIMCAGAGLTNTVFDLVHDYGGTVRSYLEFGGPNYHKATKALTMILQTQPKCILIATFGTIARADVMAEGVTTAFREINPKIPIIVAIRGTGEEKAAELLQSVGLENLDSTEVAVEKAVAYVGGVPV